MICLSFSDAYENPQTLFSTTAPSSLSSMFPLPSPSPSSPLSPSSSVSSLSPSSPSSPKRLSCSIPSRSRSPSPESPRKRTKYSIGSIIFGINGDSPSRQSESNPDLESKKETNSKSLEEKLCQTFSENSNVPNREKSKMNNTEHQNGIKIEVHSPSSATDTEKFRQISENSIAAISSVKLNPGNDGQKHSFSLFKLNSPRDSNSEDKFQSTLKSSPFIDADKKNSALDCEKQKNRDCGSDGHKHRLHSVNITSLTSSENSDRNDNLHKKEEPVSEVYPIRGPLENVYENAAKLLFIGVKWARSIPSFMQVSPFIWKLKYT